MNGNEKGLSLVEVLAALVILGILFVGIMTIFPQMTLFNNKTETKLDTMNLARQEVSVITGESEWVGQRDVVDPTVYEDFNTVLMTKMPLIGYTKISTNSNYIRYEKNAEYRYEADVYLACQTFIEEDENSFPCTHPNLTQLYKVHLKVYEGSRLSSQTFSYIRFLVGNEGG
ncbi:hypothetical protein Plano_1185 [Planococcus sp. PAMC 21323]|uniref:type IV pilus modification PilV family protein n=1 Tax=Planococcus sp. PAMC 21323 TaxID=1526927 RepID=UPI00056EEADF|nr:type II secretion system protein [Planococcus sp. PAMC 21323]AIY05150.1 hypothetical protein Plano_1185 [Planococcus sp. PAMC 21323]